MTSSANMALDKKKTNSRSPSYDDDDDDDDEGTSRGIKSRQQAGDRDLSPAAPSSSLADQNRPHHEPPPAKLREQLCSFLLCPLCQGYLIDATVASECGHAFCKSCITTYISNAKPQQKCPVCDAVLNPEYPELPLKGLRADHRRQRIVYKLVPGLFEEELRHRVQFSGSSNAETRDKVFGETMGKLTQQGGSFYSVEEYCNAILKPLAAVDKSNSTSPSLTSVIATPPAASPQSQFREVYIMTQLKTDVQSLKKFVQLKFSLEQWRTIDIGVCRNGVSEVGPSTTPVATNKKRAAPVNSNHRITDDMTLQEIAYEIKWDRSHPMRLTFHVPVKASDIVIPAKTVQVCSSSASDDLVNHSVFTAPPQPTPHTDVRSESNLSSGLPKTPPKANSMLKNAVASTNAAGNTVIRMPPPPPVSRTFAEKLKKPRTTRFLDTDKTLVQTAASPAAGAAVGDAARPFSSTSEANSSATLEKAGADTDDEKIIVVDDEDEARVSPIKISQLLKRHAVVSSSRRTSQTKIPKNQQVLASESLKQASLNSTKRALPSSVATVTTPSRFFPPAASPAAKRAKLTDNTQSHIDDSRSHQPNKHSLNLVINLNAYPNVTGASAGSSSSFNVGKMEAVETSSVIASSSSSSLSSPPANTDNGEKLTVKLRKVGDGGVWIPSAGEKLDEQASNTTAKPRTFARGSKTRPPNKTTFSNSQLSATTSAIAPTASIRPPIVSSVIKQQQTAAQKLRLQTPPTSLASPLASRTLSVPGSSAQTSNSVTSSSTATTGSKLDMPPSVTLTPTDNFRHSDALLIRMQPPSTSSSSQKPVQNIDASSVVRLQPRQPNPATSFFLSAPPKNAHGFPDAMNSFSTPVAGDFIKFNNNNMNYNMMNSGGSGSSSVGVHGAAVAAHRSGQHPFFQQCTTPTLFQQFNQPQQPSATVLQHNSQQHQFFRSPNTLAGALSPSSSLTDDAVDDAYQNAVLFQASPSPNSNKAVARSAEVPQLPIDYAGAAATRPSSVQSAFTLLNAFHASCLSMVNSSGISNNTNFNTPAVSSHSSQQNYYNNSGNSACLSAGARSPEEAMAAAGAAVAVAAFAAAAVSAVAAAANNSNNPSSHYNNATYLANQQQQAASTFGAAGGNKRRRRRPKVSAPSTINSCNAASSASSITVQSSARSRPALSSNKQPAPLSSDETIPATSSKFFAAKAVGLERVISRISSNSNINSGNVSGSSSSSLSSSSSSSTAKIL